CMCCVVIFFFQAEDGIRDDLVTGVQTCALPICKARGLSVDPKLAIGDGALGFWKAARQAWPTTKEQRCWVHKTANVLDKLPKNRSEERRVGKEGRCKGRA